MTDPDEVPFHIETVFDTPPQAVNEKGVKFWLDESLTRYATQTCQLKGVQVLCVQEPNGYKTRLVVKGGEPVYESQNLEQVAVHLDIMRLVAQA